MEGKSIGFEAAKRVEEAAERNRRRRAELSVRNNALLSMGDFRSFLKEVADRAGYFNAGTTMGDWHDGYRMAMRDIVNGIVTNSTNGGEFLAEYLAERQNSKRTEK